AELFEAKLKPKESVGGKIMRNTLRYLLGPLFVFLLTACATPTTAFSPDSEEALIIHWANKQDMVFVRVDLDAGFAFKDDRIILANRNRAPKLAFRGDREDKATARIMLDEGWDGRDTIDYATAVVEPGTYALVHAAYWFDNGIGAAWYEEFLCLADRAAVFEFESGAINTLENWSHLRTRIESEDGAEGMLTEQNDEMIRLILKEYPDLKGEIKTSPVIAFISFDEVRQTASTCSSGDFFTVISRNDSD
ncbi:MAG: hypothetical protein AAFR74_07445, partial [Pseudomonadota bacterium]